MPESDWRQSRYLFHVHTSYTDGRLTADDYVGFAEKAGAKSVVFLEHIRREPRYDVSRFSAEVRDAARGSVQSILGFEAKLLPDGTLDLSDDCLVVASVVGIAEHAFPDDRGLLRDAFLNVVRTYPSRWPQVTFLWVHPGLWFLNRRVDAERDEAYLQMLTAACDAGVLIEQNLRYGLLSPTTAAMLTAQSVVTGADAHSLLDLERWAAQLPDAAFPKQSTGAAQRPPSSPKTESGAAFP